MAINASVQYSDGFLLDVIPFTTYIIIMLLLFGNPIESNEELLSWRDMSSLVRHRMVNALRTRRL